MRNIERNLFKECYRGNDNGVRGWLNYSPELYAYVNTQQEDGKTPLHIAVIVNSIKVAKCSIENGADVNITDNYGETPLDIAINNHQEEMINLLLKYRAKSSEELNKKNNKVYKQKPVNNYRKIRQVLRLITKSIKNKEVKNV